MMKKISTFIFLIIVSNICFANKVEPYPLDYFAMRDVIQRVSLSPDGSRLALLKNPSKKGNPILEVYYTDNLNKKPLRVNANPMEITNYYWVSNSNIVMSFRQKVRDQIEGFNRGVYEGLIGKLDVEKESLRKFKEVNPGIASTLPEESEKVILSFRPEGISSPDPRFRPLSYYEFDLKSGRKSLVMRGNLKHFNVRFDDKGNPVFANGFDVDKGEFVYYLREPGKDEWKEIYRINEKSFEDFSIEGFDPLNPKRIIVSAHNGNDTRGLWVYDYNNKKFEELLYQRKDVDVVGVRHHSNRWTKPNEIVGVVYAKDKYHTEFFDPQENALYDQVSGLIKNSHSIQIPSRSKDGSSIVVFNSGPKDPGTYYLIHKGKLSKIGSRQPNLEPEKLANVKYIKYKSRDGKTLHAYVTVPNGKGPFPAIVMPHGGPFVQEVVGYDEWGQMLANNGYLVVQPQYRGSQGYGIDYYRSAFLPKGLGGYQMQDDKDDAVLHLVKEGLVDKDRIAMFGWSYGGYAALIAASRKPQIYQCAIAGAAVSDNKYQLDQYRDRMRDDSSSSVEQLNFWTDSISPIKEVSKVNIPLLMIHGSVDQRVPPEHAKRYLEEARETGTKVDYVVLDGADHFSNTLFYDHQKLLYESMISYLQNKCGPEGL